MKITQAVSNILSLCYKELKSLLSDMPLVVMIVVLFTVVLVSTYKNVVAEVRNATVAVVNEDNSQLSNDLLSALSPPRFKRPVDVRPDKVIPALNKSEYIFVINIPKNFQSDIVNFNDSKIQLLVDATSMTQAGVGTNYIQMIFTQQLLKFFHLDNLESLLPTQDNSKIYFNPNNETGRYSSVMQLVMNITLLSLILVGAAVIREKERGTIEHLLVMPVSIFEIALAKIIANGMVILIAAMVSLYLVIHLWLSVPINGSILLLLISCWAYIFTVTSLGMFLATLIPSMPQYSLIVTPIIMISHLTSGSASPVEAMSERVQAIVNFSPTTHFVYNMQDIVYRGTGFDSIANSLGVIVLYGLFFFVVALLRFKAMLQKFN